MAILTKAEARRMELFLEERYARCAARERQRDKFAIHSAAWNEWNEELYGEERAVAAILETLGWLGYTASREKNDDGRYKITVKRVD